MPEMDERRPLSFVAAALWTIGVMVLLEVAIAVTESARPGALTDLVNVTACHALAYSVVVFAMLRVYDPETPVREVIALRVPSLPLLVLGVAACACLYPALNALDALTARKFPPSQEDLDLLGQLMSTSTVARRAVLGASLLAVMPLAEEVLYRGVLFGGLRRTHGAAAVIFGTAVYFAIARADARSFASIFALGAVLGWLRDRTGSIVTTALAQAAFFAVPVVPILRGRDPLADEVYPRAWVWGGLAIAAACAALVEAWARRARASAAVAAGDP